ncbi:1-acylglycerol-3-phosphate O-acyltransferase [Pseudomonas sp. F1_0610]|uniref:1-acylglycerol-3-phosphate O-acyltransferase n=1 Tax=Pseudomonas sp. F1_0610 TaxID=3114284 RepID=UPI0039C083AC
MLAFIRVFIIVSYSITVSLLALVFCLFRPRHPNNAVIFGRILSVLTPVLGLRVVTRVPASIKNLGSCVYIGNHQSNYDVLMYSCIVPSGTVSVGKKSLLWVPFFGLMYWATGNVLLDRKNSAKARSTIDQIADQIKQRNLSIWMFPEGTRSQGRGLLPFKMGAFHAAIAAKVPVVAVCMSETYQQIKLNRWNNGTVILEMLEPISTENYTADRVRELAAKCHRQMEDKYQALTEEKLSM